MDWKWITTTALVAGLLVHAGTAQTDPAPSPATIVVDTGTLYQTIDNFGSSARVLDDPHVWKYRSEPNDPAPPAMTRAEQDEVLDLLYRDGGLTYLRFSSDVGLAPSPGRFEYEGRKLDAQIDLALRAQERGPVKVAFTVSRFPPEPWMKNAVKDYADYFVAAVERARSKGLVIDYLTFNEPPIRAELARDVIRSVTRRLPPTIRWIVPEAKHPAGADAYLRVLLADETVRSVTAAVATHLYGGNQVWPALSRLKAAADEYGLPLWMSEFSGHDPWQWAELQHRLLVTYSVSAVDYMWGFFGRYDSAQLLMLESDDTGRYRGVRPRKQFAVMRHWSRYVQPGARRVGASCDDSSILVSAFTSPTQTILVAYNAAAAAKTVSIQMPGSHVESVRTSQTEDLATVPAAAFSAGRMTTVLPPKSITTFVTDVSSLPGAPAGLAR